MRSDSQSIAIVAGFLLLQLSIVLTQGVTDRVDLILLSIAVCLPAVLLLLTLFLSPNKSIWQLIVRIRTGRKVAIAVVLLVLVLAGAANGAILSTIGMAIMILSIVLFIWTLQFYVLDHTIRPSVSAIRAKLSSSKSEKSAAFPSTRPLAVRGRSRAWHRFRCGGCGYAPRPSHAGDRQRC